MLRSPYRERPALPGSWLLASRTREPAPAALDKRLSKLGGARLGASGFCSAPGFGPAVHLGSSLAAAETKACRVGR